MSKDKMPHCKATLSYGSAWVAGRQRCSKTAVGEEGLCGTHLRQLQRREERKSR